MIQKLAIQGKSKNSSCAMVRHFVLTIMLWIVVRRLVLILILLFRRQWSELITHVISFWTGLLV